MRLITPPLVIEEDEPFKNDILGRKAYGQALLNLVAQSNDELVISLDGQWGEGKTTFVKMWQGLLNQSDIPNIYIDAFANDYIDDAFITIASAITSYADSKISKPDEKAIEDFKDKTKKIGVRLLSWSARLAAKVATLGALSATDIEELKEIKNDLAKDTSTAISKFIEERLTSHSQDVELLGSFKELLSDLPKHLQKEDGKEKPLVIIIDELDRCKPTFAVEVIEKIKHLFSVKKVVFVLVMNKKQLEGSIKCIYGQDIDAHAYLQKFINVETTVPKRMNDPRLNDVTKYCEQLTKLHELKRNENTDQLSRHIKQLAIRFNLTLRQMEKVFTNIAIFYATTAQNEKPIVQIVSFVCIIKVIDNPLFQELSNRKVSYDELRHRIDLSDESISAGHSDFSFLLSWIKWAVLTDHEFEQLAQQDQIRKYNQVLIEYGTERRAILPSYSQRLSMFSVE
mgnify:CR=1 FL=1